MKIQPYIEKLENSREYKQFQIKHKDAFLVAGFFVMDFETGINIHQIDYFIPKEKKVAAFTLDDDVELRVLETMNEKIPEKLNIQTNVDLDAIKGILEDEMKNRNITEKIKKVIAVVQTIDGKKIWLLNCILSGMEILKAHVDDESRTVLSMEKTSIMDYVKKVPAGEIIKKDKLDEKEIESQIDQLDKLKLELEKEKEKITKNKNKKVKSLKKK
ncbi:MAG: hypothetical protein Q8P57_03775 [Candidatus Pacearchaeota archaeon]|nr:hypothetical protein [Candidatus Pacearchaeota archaeon]